MGKNYPWLRLMKDTKRDPKVALLPLEQQAVFYNLLQHAGLQDEEGTFDDSDTVTLALEVATGREDVLLATIASLVDHRVLTRLPDGRLLFVAYERNQATSREINAARQRRFYQRQHASGDVGDRQAPNAERYAPNDKEREREEEIDAAAITTNFNARPREEEDPAAAVLTVLGVEPGGDDAEIVREAMRSHPDQPHLLKARECKTDDWRSLSPRRRASRYHNWLLGAKRIQEEQSASRAPPGNGAPTATAADHFLPDDPDEMARIQREYEVRENRAAERRNRSSLGSAGRTGGPGQRPDRTGHDEPPG